MSLVYNDEDFTKACDQCGNKLTEQQYKRSHFCCDEHEIIGLRGKVSCLESYAENLKTARDNWRSCANNYRKRIDGIIQLVDYNREI